MSDKQVICVNCHRPFTPEPFAMVEGETGLMCDECVAMFEGEEGLDDELERV